MSLVVRLVGITSLLCSSFACSSDDDAGGAIDDPESLNDLPPGTADGEAFAGVYDIELFTSVCEGECTTTIEGWQFVACNLGDVTRRQIQIQQTDGDLSLIITGYSVQRLAGGVDQDGTFDVGGYARDSQTGIESTARVVGTFEAEADAMALTGEVDGWVWGDGGRCRTGYEVTGSRSDLID